MSDPGGSQGMTEQSGEQRGVSSALTLLGAGGWRRDLLGSFQPG